MRACRQYADPPVLRAVRPRDPERKADVIGIDASVHSVQEDELVLEPFEVRDEPTAPTVPAEWLQAIPPPLPPSHRDE